MKGSLVQIQKVWTEKASTSLLFTFLFIIWVLDFSMFIYEIYKHMYLGKCLWEPFNSGPAPGSNEICSDRLRRYALTALTYLELCFHYPHGGAPKFTEADFKPKDGAEPLEKEEFDKLTRVGDITFSSLTKQPVAYLLLSSDVLAITIHEQSHHL